MLRARERPSALRRKGSGGDEDAPLPDEQLAGLLGLGPRAFSSAERDLAPHGSKLVLALLHLTRALLERGRGGVDVGGDDGEGVRVRGLGRRAAGEGRE